jgi:hypothetical protein
MAYPITCLDDSCDELGDKTQGTVGWYPPLHHKSEYNSVFFRIEFMVPLFDGTMVPHERMYTLLSPTGSLADPPPPIFLSPHNYPTG